MYRKMKRNRLRSGSYWKGLSRIGSSICQKFGAQREITCKIYGSNFFHLICPTSLFPPFSSLYSFPLLDFQILPLFLLPLLHFSPFSSDYFLVLLPPFILFSPLISVSPSPSWSPVRKSHLWKSRMVTGPLKCHAWHIISQSFTFNTLILYLWSIALINSTYMHVCTHAHVCVNTL